MPHVPPLSDVIVLGLATFALAAFFRYSSAGGPVRTFGAWAGRQGVLLRLLFSPARATAACTFCTACWVALGLVAAMPGGLVQMLVAAAGAVGVATLADVTYEALQGQRATAMETPESRLKVLLSAQREAPPPPPRA